MPTTSGSDSPIDRWSRLERAFLEALERPPHERAAFVASVVPDADLRHEVLAMLAAEQDTGTTLHIERRFITEMPGPVPLVEGTLVGPYRVIELAGRGGMGEVYRARRIDGVLDLEVALKLLRADVRSASLIQRFHVERRVLARLTHPHIATILDAGTADDGRPWLALRFVEGAPLTAATRGRSLDDRVALFLKVVDAVGFAHANLVVHRDLKPGNILVAASGEPVLLDFGIATLLDESDVPHTTQSNDRLLTPSYAAPEQRTGGIITTATDVYALGALLFEVLTDSRLSGTTHADETTAPSSRGLPLASAFVRDAATRRRIVGDLDAIVQKALADAAHARYATASQLADDIRRWQRGDAVIARPETWSQRTSRTLRRYRGAVLAVAATVVLLIAGLTREVVQSQRISAERDRAIAERTSGEAVLSFVTDLLATSDPRVTPGGDSLRVRDLLTRAETGAGALTVQPERQVRLYRLLGHVRAGRGELARAESLLILANSIGRDSLGPDHPETLRTQLELISAQLDRQGSIAVGPRIGPLIASLRRVLGPTHEDVSTAYGVAAIIAVEADSARVLLDSSIAVRARLGVVDSVEIASQLDSRAAERGRRRQWSEARTLEEAALRIVTSRFPSDHPYVLTVQGNLATYAGNAGDHARAVKLSREVLRQLQRDTASSRRLGGALERLALSMVNMPGMLDSAAAYEQEALRALRRELVPEHPLITNAMRNLAIIRAAQGNVGSGLALLDSAVARARGGPDVAGERYVVGQRVPMLIRLGKVAEARASLGVVRSVIDKYEIGSDRWMNVQLWSGLVDMASNNAAGALSAWQTAVERASADIPPTSRTQMRCAVGIALYRTGRRADATSLLDDACASLASWALADQSLLRWRAEAVDSSR